MSSTTVSLPSAERAAELRESLKEVRARVSAAQAQSPTHERVAPAATLVAVSKLKPAADILACYEDGQRDFGENYVQELEEKAAQLPLPDIRWHFIGTFQSNKAKTLAAIPNLYAVQTVTSEKGAAGLNKYIAADRPPLNVLLQVNTSGEAAKSGLPPLDAARDAAGAELTQLARFVVEQCPRLRLQGLMTIGALEASLAAAAARPNADFERLVATRDLLQAALAAAFPGEARWGVEGRLVLSMGMSSDFEAALVAGSDIVRVGTGIFGSRPKKGEAAPAS
ncbi:pyridoxal phosphate homeostasis protein [Phanerochaete sordida]|uniref:Pyridoxal phosphate homeostasis protein n=1 Tax=Phanerochaete sordida TaxID=48140 RepID=A0A9P3FYX7_9APHY|nr:pyridoxal phosphate homeostasis protein [Phanerochaete sordida]